MVQKFQGLLVLRLVEGDRHLIALTREAADVSGIPYVMEAGLHEAEAILDGAFQARTVSVYG